MKLTNNQFKILKYVYNHSYQRIDTYKNFRGISLSQRDSILQALSNNGLIKFSIYNSFEADNGEILQDISTFAHPVTTDSGDILIQEKQRNFYMFFFSYGVTTLIAIASLIISILK